MKVYSDMKGAYILIRNKYVLEGAGFEAGVEYNIEVRDGRIILEPSINSLEEA